MACGFDCPPEDLVTGTGDRGQVPSSHNSQGCLTSIWEAEDLLEFKASLGQNNTEVKTERKEGREEEGRKERRQLGPRSSRSHDSVGTPKWNSQGQRSVSPALRPLPLHSTHCLTFHLSFLVNFIYVYWWFACVCVCVPHVCLVASGARRGHQIP